MRHIKILQQVSSVMLTYDDRCDFVENNVTEQYQDYNTDEFMVMMSNMCEVVTKVLDTAKDGLVYMAIEGSLEGDMNQLDWDEALTKSDKDWREL